ncbi:hypothetical protein QN277_010579 [Acacia crassicarpa]|uniref:DUF4283 domain-containing protein n=1 Tax=Acacia crassicarpa TaxID=499986 RepID=A0AAE1M4U9_9FABA|nr:hypothetical protein QN277_010579 [Acacia crassicarpa]
MALVISKKVPPKNSSSSEEEDLFQRSLKKSKNNENPSLNAEWPELGAQGKKPWVSGPSFAEKLQGIVKPAKVNNVTVTSNDLSDDPISDSDHGDSASKMHEPLCVIKEDPNRNFPTFSFSDRMKKRLYKAWDKAVIVKLLGKDIGYMLLQSILQPLWAKRGVINLINIGNGFFVVKFSNKDDYLNALTGGPWMIFDHYLTVRPWEPMFHPMRATINKVAVWVRLPRVFLEYYDKEALSWIGNRIGDILKIDMNTSGHLRGHYARICVLVDLAKQLMSGFTLDGIDYFLEYEGLHLLCTSCGIYGHTAGECNKGKNSQKSDGKLPEEGCCLSKASEATGEGSSGNFDVWKVVNKPRRPRKGGKEKASSVDHQKQGGSRFEVLGGEGDDAAVEKSTPEVAVTPSGTFIGKSNDILKGVEKRGKGSKKHGRNKSKTRDSKLVEGGQTEKRSEKRTREERRKGSKSGEILCITSENANENVQMTEEVDGMQKGNLMFEGPEAADQGHGNSEMDPVGSFQIEPGEGGLPQKLEGKFWAGPKALDPDDMWEEEAQLTEHVMVGLDSACHMDEEAQPVEDRDSIISETQ